MQVGPGIQSFVFEQDTFLYQGRNTMVNAGRDTLDGGL